MDEKRWKGEALVKEKKKYKFDRQFVRRLILCLRIPFSSFSTDSSILFILLLGLCLGQQLVYLNVGLLPSEYMVVLGNKDKSGMKVLLLKSFLIILAISLVKSSVKLVSGYLYLNWRDAITRSIQKLYLSDLMYYKINSDLLFNKIDNPDQRITQDVDRFSMELSQISADLVISPFVIVYYSVQCFSVSGAMGPLIIYSYFIFGTIINKIIMSFIVNLVYQQERKEGDFRFKHVQIRNHSESIAFIGSEKHELWKITRSLKLLLKAQKKIVKSELFLDISTNINDYIGSILSYIIVSIPIFSGRYKNTSSVELSALISKNAFISMYLIHCFSTLIDLSSKWTDISGYTHRIGELLEELYSCKQCESKESISEKKYNDLNENVLCKITNLSYSSPSSEKFLVYGLNLQIQINKNVLILGNTGSGKSSLLRILRKLWMQSSGSFEFNSKNMNSQNVMFLPQNPILTNGSLVDQIVYPLLKKQIGNYVGQVLQDVLKALDNVGLSHLIKRIGDVDEDPYWDWDKKLSPGEIQRISFARLFFHQPKLAFLDEATSALGLSEEDCFYRYCKTLGITLVSIGHRSSLKEYHDFCVRFKGSGMWEYYELHN